MAERKLLVKIVGDESDLVRSFRKSSNGARNFEKDIGKASRGALAGSGIFRGLGRSIAFASGGFLAFATAGDFLRKSVDAAKEAAVTQAQLAAQFRSSGQDLGRYQEQIDKTASRLSALAGIEDDEVKAGFITIFRTTGNVSKSLRDLGTAADLARAKHLSLAQAALIIAKTEAGNTTLLRRQGFQIGKNVKSEEALATLRRAVAGQARAGTTEQERFGAVLHRTEEIVGTGLLPTLNKYLDSGTKWLEQMNESGDLQRKVSDAADGFAKAVDGVVSAVKTVDKVTGSFKNTLELLIGLKIASSLAGMATSVGLIGRNAKTATGEVGGLRAALGGLAGINPIVIPIALAVGGDRLTGGHNIATDLKNALTGENNGRSLGNILFGSNKENNLFNRITGRFDKGGDDAAAAIRISAAKVARETTNFGVAVARSINQAGDTIAKAGPVFSANSNKFFDNAISRILLRGGLGDLQQQLVAIQKASGLISKRIRATKDVTRKLNLEDQLLQLQAQGRDVRSQIADQIRQRTQDARDRAKALAEHNKQLAEEQKQRLKELAATKLAQRTARQFRELGLSATGDPVTPSVANLRKQLGTLSLRATTPKLRSELARIRKVLSEGLVPKDVRAKIAEMFNDIRAELGKQGNRNQTKFRHASSNVILSGLGLTPDQIRALRSRLSQIGAGGTVPGSRSAAFSGAGAQFTVTTNVNLDGQKVGSSVTRHQQKAAKRRTTSRRGAYAGRH